MKFTLTLPLLFCALATAELVHQTQTQTVTAQTPTGKCTRFETQKEAQTPDEKAELEAVTELIRKSCQMKGEPEAKKMEMDCVEKVEQKTTVTITSEKEDGEKDEQEKEKKDHTVEVSKNEKNENAKDEDEGPAKAFTEFINNMMRNLSVQLDNEEKEGLLSAR